MKDKNKYILGDHETRKERNTKQKKTKGYSQETSFKLVLYTVYLISIFFILRNFQAMFFTTNINQFIYYLTLQLISMPMILGFIWRFLKFRKKYFSLEPDKRKSYYKVKSWIMGIIGVLLVVNLMLYTSFFDEAVEILYGHFSVIRMLYDISLVIGFPLWLFGILMIVCRRKRID